MTTGQNRCRLVAVGIIDWVSSGEVHSGIYLRLETPKKRNTKREENLRASNRLVRWRWLVLVTMFAMVAAACSVGWWRYYYCRSGRW